MSTRYSLPTHVTPAGWLLYNKAIFADAGVAEPTDGQWSYADFDAALLESWHALRRGGAAFIITYGARLGRALGLAAR